jgi:hypothetical protein
MLAKFPRVARDCFCGAPFKMRVLDFAFPTRWPALLLFLHPPVCTILLPNFLSMYPEIGISQPFRLDLKGSHHSQKIVNNNVGK